MCGLLRIRGSVESKGQWRVPSEGAEGGGSRDDRWKCRGSRNGSRVKVDSTV